MREIKFRVWDAADKGFSTCEMHSPDPVMQYTGLKDKDGTEIYEGDIIEFYAEESVVYWHETGFYMNTFRFDRTELMDAYKRWGDAFEVIGNIYENSELL